MSAAPPPSDRPPSDRSPADPLETIREALSALRFGGISVTVHEGRVVQIEITEKRRFGPS
ncbi:MAG TPA: YezD family protein [Novosphingobium sp.]|nr:YezD family protein [Novosphingobium sp.]HMP55993.1 YezD family protein [Novosphingobium sp.]